MKIALLCNHPLAFSSIEALLDQNLLVGLGVPQIMSETAFRVQLIAQDKGIPFAMIDPQNKSRSLKEWLNKCKPDIVFVITFPYKIPADILRIPRFGFFNWHTGLLPNYRGADPIFWQIANQEEYGGVTLHQMDENFDTGPIVYLNKEEIPYNSQDEQEVHLMNELQVVNGSLAVKILPEDTYGQHVQKLAIAAKKNTDYLVNKLSNNPQQLKLVKQDPNKGQYYKKPDFMDLIIDWEKQSAPKIKALIRATNPLYGGAITFFRGVPVHLLQVSIGSLPNPRSEKPGTIISSSAKESIVVLTSDQKLLRLDVLYTEDGFFTGGKLASIFNIKEGEVFTMPPIDMNALKEAGQ